jgi:hypothetical protein
MKLEQRHNERMVNIQRRYGIVILAQYFLASETIASEICSNTIPRR